MFSFEACFHCFLFIALFITVRFRSDFVDFALYLSIFAFYFFAFVANMPKHLTLSDCRVPFLR